MSTADRLQRWKYPITLTLVFLTLPLGFVALGWLDYQRQFETVQTAVNQKLSLTADYKIRQINQWREAVLGELKLIQSMPVPASEIEGYLAHPESLELKKRILNWINPLKSVIPAQRVLLMDENQKIQLVSDDAPCELPVDVRNLVQQTLADGQIRSTDLYMEENGQIHIDFLAPVYSQDLKAGRANKAIALLIVQLNPGHYLYPMLQVMSPEWMTHETLLLRREGDSVLYLSELRFRKNTPLKYRRSISGSTELLAARAANGESAFVAGEDYRNVPVWGYMSPIPGTSWFLESKVDREEVLRAFMRQFKMLGMTGAVMLITAVLSMGFAWRRHEKRILKRELDRVAKDMAELERKKNSNELQSEFMNTLLEHTQSGIVACNAQGELILFNKAARDWHGMDAIAVPKEEWANYYNLCGADGTTPLNSEEVPLLRAFREEIVQDCEISIVTAGKEKRHVLCNASPFYNYKLEFLGAVTVMLDITERKLAEDKIGRINEELEERVRRRTRQLETSNKELEAFSYSVSHDLRAPLRAIDGFVSILAQDYKGKLDEEGVRYLGIISSEAQRMGQLIDDLLAFSRVTRIEMRCFEIDISKLCLEVFQSLENERSDRTIDFKLGEMPPASGDPSLIRQVLFNLIENAIKFTRPMSRAEIVIDGCSEGRENIYRVKDNGVGFDKKFAGKLFGVFQRLHSSEQFKGTGVGLALVQRIILRHGGRIWAESEINQGAVFYFTLPKKESNEKNA